ncbi:MAG TPA: DUF3365 domain-containing protein [Opitutaceae bacterium]|nr:DUF3365 domain-containing protein [Opitutaceae bacterium]
MKIRLASLVVALTAITGVELIAADADSAPPAAAVEAEPTTPAVDATFVDPDSAEAEPYRAVGDRAIDRFGVTIVSEASRAARDGPVNALALCHLKGIPVQGGFVGGVNRITAVKLTSLKVRDPANAPDPAEELALARVQSGIDLGMAPEILVQRIDSPGGGHEWRVYRPVAVLRQCAICHGPADQQPADLRAALQARYPNDQADGYQTGEWRGLIRVTVADPAPPAAAKPAVPPAKR